MAKMLGNIIGRTCFPYDDFYPRSWKQELVQTQRSRERDAWARELRRDMPEPTHEWYCLDELSACYDGMCECDCHGDQDWKRGGENAMILESMARVDGVPFDGTYTVGP